MFIYNLTEFPGKVIFSIQFYSISWKGSVLYTILQNFVGKECFLNTFTVFPEKAVFYIRFTSPR